MDVCRQKSGWRRISHMIYFGRAIPSSENPECEHYPQLYDLVHYKVVQTLNVFTCFELGFVI